MTMRSVTYKAGDVVVVPFPFTDNIEKTKRRPVVILSSSSFNRATGQCVCAMITSSEHHPWPHDVRIKGKEDAGLQVDCCIRMKLFTLDQQFILRGIGHLGKSDKAALHKALAQVITTHD